MPNIEKETIKTILHQGPCEVVFTKANGEERQMICTLQDELLPLRDPDAPAGVSPEKEGTIVAWDLEAEGWRSFKLSTVISGPVLI